MNYVCLCQTANNAAHSRFETQLCHKKSETGVSVARKFTCVQQRIFLKSQYLANFADFDYHIEHLQNRDLENLQLNMSFQ